MSNRRQSELPMGRDEQAAAWCLRLAEGQLTPREQVEFDDWMAHPANSEAFAEAVAIWRGVDRVADEPELIRVRAQALESFRAANGRRWAPPAFGGWRLAGMAATLLLGVILAFQFLGPHGTVYETGIGERRVVLLADGSRLSMDAATRIETRLSRESRKLLLRSGRAKFDVAKDPLRPFSVMSGDKVVVAVGTSFSVERLQDKVRVLLYEGHVEVLEQKQGAGAPRALRFSERAASSGMHVLEPGRELVTSIGKDSATIMATDPPRSLSWENGQLSFVNEPLPSAIERMNRYSQEPLEIGDVEAARARVNGVFTAGDVQAFAEGVTTFSPIEVVHRSGKWIFVTAAKKNIPPQPVLRER